MNISLIFAFIGTGLNTINDLIYRKVAVHSKINNYFFYIIASISSAITAFIINFAVYGHLGIKSVDIGYGILLGFISFVVYLLFLLSFSGGSTAMSVTIYRLNMVTSTILAILLLNEHISGRRAAGILLCILTIIMFAAGEKNEKRQNKKPVYFSIGACLLGGILNYANKVAVINGAIPLNLLFWRFLTVSILSCVLISRCKGNEFSIKDITYPLFSGITLLMAIYFILIALKGGDLSLILPITQLSFVITSLISVIVFKEKMDGFKILGIGIAAVAIFLLI